MEETIPQEREEVDVKLSSPDAGLREWLKETEGDFGVLGSGGKMGTTFAQMLRRGLTEAGMERRVYGVSRYSRPGQREYHEALGIEAIGADLGEPEAVAKLPEMENLIFLVGEKFGTADSPERAWIQNVIIPGLIARRYPGSRILVLSTGCVYPFEAVTGGGSTEEDAPDPVGEYAYTCLGRERVFDYYSRKNGTPVSIARLNYANEYRYGVLVDIALRVYHGEAVDLSTPYVNVIWQKDAVSRCLRCLRHADSPPRIVNITGPEKASVRELAEGFGKFFGKPVHFTGEPSESAWLSSAALSGKLFGPPETGLAEMTEWIGGYIVKGGELLDKPT
ncbi:MAG: NAD(P)-dependent oxidoreductase, partial [Oceanipulchritudo sp.]